MRAATLDAQRGIPKISTVRILRAKRQLRVRSNDERAGENAMVGLAQHWQTFLVTGRVPGCGNLECEVRYARPRA